MKEKIFVDTSAWLALANKRDEWHRKAKEIRQALIKQNCTFWVSKYVIVEIANTLSKINFRRTAVNLVESILKSNEMNLTWIDQELFDESWNLFKEGQDKESSLTDCTIINIMMEYGITTAFTNDHHFEQAGFQILLKELNYSFPTPTTLLAQYRRSSNSRYRIGRIMRVIMVEKVNPLTMAPTMGK